MEFSTLNGYKVKDKKAIRFYDNVDSMKNDSTLKEGMHVKTKGYYSINDGGCSEYHITSTESQTEYQEELNNNLYATLILKDIINVKQFGAKGDGITDDTQSIQKALSYHGNNMTKIFFDKSDGYFLDGTLQLFSNTHIDFNNQKIYIKTSEVLFKNNYDSNNRANPIENIIIENAYFDGTSPIAGTYCNSIKFGLLKAKNIKILNNVFYKSSNNRHNFDMGGCENVLIERNYFHNIHIDSGSKVGELIQLDNATYTGLPYWDESSTLYDNSGCKNITIKGNIFKQDDYANNFINAIGSHSYLASYPHENIVIESNEFDEPNYANIKGYYWKKVRISNNIFKIHQTRGSLSETPANIKFISATVDEINYTTEDCIINDNNFYNSSSSSNMMSISLAGYQKNFNIHHNIIEGNYDGVNTTTAVGITVNSSREIAIDSNILTKVRNAIYGTSNTNVLITSNLIRISNGYINLNSTNTNVLKNGNYLIDGNDDIVS